MPAERQTVDLVGLSAISKEIFPKGDQVFVQMDRQTPALDLIERTNRIPFMGKVSSDGRYLLIPVITDDSPNAAVPYPESGGLATPGRAETDTWQYNVVDLNQALKITGKVLDTVTGGAASVQSGLSLQMREQMPAARKELSRLLHRGGSSLRAIVSATDGAQTVTVDDTSILKVGMDIHIRLREGNGTLLGGQTETVALQIQTIPSSTSFTVLNEDGTTPTLTNPGDTTYGVYRWGAQALAPWGFANLVGQSNPTDMGSDSSPIYFGGVDRDVVAGNWARASDPVDALGGSIEIGNHIEVMIDNIMRNAGDFLPKASDGEIWDVFLGYQNWRTIGAALKADQRTAPNYVKLRGGWQGMEYEGAMFVKDVDAPPSRLRFIHGPSANRYVVRNWWWNTRDGNSIWQMTTTPGGRFADAYIAFLMTRQNMLATRCSTNGEIFNTSATR